MLMVFIYSCHPKYAIWNVSMTSNTLTWVCLRVACLWFFSSTPTESLFSCHVTSLTHISHTPFPGGTKLSILQEVLNIISLFLMWKLHIWAYYSLILMIFLISLNKRAVICCFSSFVSWRCVFHLLHDVTDWLTAHTMCCNRLRPADLCTELSRVFRCA